MTTIEFRDRSQRAPDGDFRIFLGRSEKATELKALKARRELLQRLALRGEWDVLTAVRDGAVTVEQLERVVDHYGVANFRAHLELNPKPSISVPTLERHVERFLESVEKKGTRKTYGNGLGHLVEFTLESEAGPERLGDRPWPDVFPHHVVDVKVHLQDGLARSTLSTYMASWSAFYSWAIRRERSQAQEAGREPLKLINPVKDAEAWVSVKATRQRFLSWGEYQALLEVCPDYMRCPYATLVFTGLRGGEFYNLPPNHVTLAKIHVGPWGDWVPKGYPRVNRGIRDVPIHRVHLRPLLEEYIERWAGTTYLFLNPRTGGQWTRSAFARQFAIDAEAAGMVAGSVVDGKAQPEGVTPHTTRHTFASWLAMADVQLMKIAKLMGDREETVRDYYAHLIPSTLDESVNRLGSVRLADDFSEDHPL